jgi:hypothetical protein
MLLSFSIAPMLPMVRAGLDQRNGVDVGDARVKRQTIRRRGTRGLALLERAAKAGWTIPYDLHLWWKSRTPEKAHIGTAYAGPPRYPPNYCYPIQILHSETIDSDGRHDDIWRIDGPRGWRKGSPMVFWTLEGFGNQPFEEEACNDGFESARDFCNFFAPNLGDRFEGVLFKW